MDVRAFMDSGIWLTIDCKKLEYVPGLIYVGFPSSEGFGVAGESYSNFLASTGPCD